MGGMRRFLALAALVGAILVHSSARAQVVTISVEDGLEVTPPAVQIDAGMTVTFTNDGLLVHNVVADDGVFESPLMAPGDSWSTVLDVPGTHAFHCMLHPGLMAGTITVR